jgi:hypothetical protein
MECGVVSDEIVDINMNITTKFIAIIAIIVLLLILLLLMQVLAVCVFVDAYPCALVFWCLFSESSVTLISSTAPISATSLLLSLVLG